MDECRDVQYIVAQFMAIRWLAIQQTGEDMMMEIEIEEQQHTVTRHERKFSLTPIFMPFFKIIILNQRKLIPW